MDIYIFQGPRKNNPGANDRIAIGDDDDRDVEGKPKRKYALLGDIIPLSSKSSTLKILGDMLYYVCPFSDEQNLVINIEYKRDTSFEHSPSLNFVEEYLTDIGNSPLIVGELLKTSVDDVCPVGLNGSYGAANHAWSGYGYTLTKTAHGKTLADVGSVYKDTNNVQFVIMRIVDADNLWIISKNQAVDGFSYSFPAPVGTLTYFTNGTNTGSISSYSIAAISNFYPTSGPSEVEILLDGIVQDKTDGEYPCDFVDIAESYNVYDLSSIVDTIISERPSGGYTEPVYFNELEADPLFRNVINYRLNNSGVMIISQSFITLKKINFTFDGFIQAGPLDTGNVYVPKSLPIDGGNRIYELTNIEDWTTAPTNTLMLTSAYWEVPTSPPDRVVNFNNTVSYHYGYLTDRGVNKDRDTEVSGAIGAMHLQNTRKLYPFATDQSGVMEAGESISSVSFRAISNPDLNPEGRTSYTWFKIGSDVFIYLDYHDTITDFIKAMPEWSGAAIEVVEKSDNVTILQDVVTSEIGVMVEIGVDTYGYAVLKLNI